MIKENIIVETVKGYDKMKMAVAIKNSTYGDELSCSLLNDGVLMGCEGCNLKFICEGLDELAADYVDDTTKVISSFDFRS